MPERFAHGYQVLRDNTETSYQVGEFYTPAHEGGLLYNDPRLGLEWPLPVTVMSDKDRVGHCWTTGRRSACRRGSDRSALERPR